MKNLSKEKEIRKKNQIEISELKHNNQNKKLGGWA